jgi:fructose-1,6-bisphosphatase/inositol monophosphatase family enzyme
VSDTSDLSLATVLTTDAQFSVAPERGAAWARLAARAGVSRTWGDCYGYLLVATGRAEVMVDPVLALWDAAPLLPIIVEAGGVFTDWRGQPTVLGGSAIATNLALAGEARAVLGDEIVEEPGPHDE